MEEYKKKEPKWEVILDLDKVSKEEGASWVWGGAEILEPDFISRWIRCPYYKGF